MDVDLVPACIARCRECKYAIIYVLLQLALYIYYASTKSIRHERKPKFGSVYP